LESQENDKVPQEVLPSPYQLLDGGFKKMKARMPVAGIVRLRQHKVTKNKKAYDRKAIKKEDRRH
jgi:hypothetical protein